MKQAINEKKMMTQYEMLEEYYEMKILIDRKITKARVQNINIDRVIENLEKRLKSDY